MFNRTSKALFVLLLIPVLAVACGGNSTPQANGGAQPLAPLATVYVKPAVTAIPNSAKPAATNIVQPTAPSAPQPAPATGGEGGAAPAGGEGGATAGESSSGPTLINPGGLPASQGNSTNSQQGEERMVQVSDPNGAFNILFVDGWAKGPGSTPTSVRFTQNGSYAEAESVPSNGQTPEQMARALDASQANGAPGYLKLALQTSNIHGLPAVSLIYQYDSGSNPVTGKPLRFIASQVFIGGGPADKLGHVTFAASYDSYGDATSVFDKTLAGFTWK